MTPNQGHTSVVVTPVASATQPTKLIAAVVARHVVASTLLLDGTLALGTSNDDELLDGLSVEGTQGGLSSLKHTNTTSHDC